MKTSNLIVALVFVSVTVALGACGRAREAHVTQARIDIQIIVSALNAYNLDNDMYPTTEQGLTALVSKPTTPPVPPHWHQYLSKVPVDPWGHDYKYQYPGIHGSSYEVWSDGPPGASPGQEIGSWNINEDSQGNNG